MPSPTIVVHSRHSSTPNIVAIKATLQVFIIHNFIGKQVIVNFRNTSQTSFHLGFTGCIAAYKQYKQKKQKKQFSIRPFLVY